MWEGSEWSLMCFLNFCLSLNSFPQMSHLSFVFLWWTWLWLRYAIVEANVLLHGLQKYLVGQCWTMIIRKVNTISQSVIITHSFGLWATSSWCLKDSTLGNACGQCLHWYLSILFSWTKSMCILRAWGFAHWCPHLSQLTRRLPSWIFLWLKCMIILKVYSQSHDIPDRLER